MPEREQRPGTHKKVQDVGQHDEVAEGDSRQEKKNRGRHEAGDGTPFMFVKCRRDKQPDLIKHYGGSQNDSQVHTHGDDKI